MIWFGFLWKYIVTFCSFYEILFWTFDIMFHTRTVRDFDFFLPGKSWEADKRPLLWSLPSGQVEGWVSGSCSGLTRDSSQLRTKDENCSQQNSTKVWNFYLLEKIIWKKSSFQKIYIFLYYDSNVRYFLSWWYLVEHLQLDSLWIHIFPNKYHQCTFIQSSCRHTKSV